ncbi:TMEM175 family protein [Brevundimonas goettingensis]|uniref:DUF1211 domain-containing protein n=1 Tax=Brevundimonas goettingensis TaxID=2774190 RepID=A0A975C6A9_9CAUL|nr:TMEM175 family protein [Brevundimonas goettingensis]QTC92377.1 DUF1211 domain-containing protein [Brevundimonas goettingensis]
MTDHTHEIAHQGDPGLDRLLFFSDGVFAIAITLLSIELHVPHGWDGSFAGLMNASWKMLGAFAISFAVIGVLWNAHRRCFLKMTRFTSGVFVLNLFVLAGIALMPFATSLLYENPHGGDAFLIYLSLVALTGVAQGLTYGYAAFVADVIRPRQHAMMRFSAFLMQTLMPGLCCGLTLLALGRAPLWIVIGLAVSLTLLISFRVFAAKRFGPAAVAA